MKWTAHSVQRRARLSRLGLTLTEVIVVMAIVAMMTAVALPTLTRMGLLSHDDLVRSSREVFKLVNTTRLYASTFRVNAALVYVEGTRQDTFMTNASTGEPLNTPIVDGLGIAWRPRREDFASGPLSSIPQSQRNFTYVLVNDAAGRVREMAENTCIQNAIVAAGNYVAIPGSIDIYLYDSEGNPIPPRSIPGSYRTAAGTFPAHVFTPSGEMVTRDGDMARLHMDITATPDSEMESRYIDVPTTLDEEPALRRRAGLDLYPVSGRAKMVDRYREST